MNNNIYNINKTCIILKDNAYVSYLKIVFSKCELLCKGISSWEYILDCLLYKRTLIYKQGKMKYFLQLFFLYDNGKILIRLLLDNSVSY